MDSLLKVIALNKEVKVYIVNTTDLTNDTIMMHDLWPSAASVLGKTLTIGLMMGASLKGDESLTIKIDGSGPIGQVIVDATSYGTIRGYVSNPHVNFTKHNHLDEVTTLGYNGYIDVIKDLKMDQFFTSSIDIQTGDLAKDFTYYFAKSEQTPSAILLGSIFDVDNRCKICGGLLIQLMPNASEETIVYLENKIKELPDFSTLLSEHNDLEDILKIIFENNYEVVQRESVFFRCPCSKERFKHALFTLKTEDLQEMLEKDNGAEITCHYCNSKYQYTKEDLEELITKKGE